MSASIFIKTWSEDLKWLRYSLESISRYASGFDEVVIACDKSCIDDLKKMDTGSSRIVAVDDWRNGYIQQQWVKLCADQHLKSDYVLFVDSDCVFHTPFSPESYMRDSLPILLKTRYGNLGGAEAWKSITESVVGFPVEYEYMRRLPWMYRTSSLKSFRKTYPSLQRRLREMPGRDFSEFNALGAFIERYEPSQYFISDTEVWYPEAVSRQFWSWGGITEEVIQEMRGFVK